MTTSKPCRYCGKETVQIAGVGERVHLSGRMLCQEAAEKFPVLRGITK